MSIDAGESLVTEHSSEQWPVNSPPVEDDSPEPVSDESLEQARSLLLCLHKVFSGARMYHPGHPALMESFQRLYRGFDSFFEKEQFLVLQLTESEILYKGLPVYQESEKRGALLFMLFNDGIREISFEAGLSREEIMEFVEILKTNASLPQEERDMIGLFWARGFRHIQYLAVEEIPDQEIETVDIIINQLESRHSEPDMGGSSEKNWMEGPKYEIHEAEKHSRLPFPAEIVAKARSICQEEMEKNLKRIWPERAFDGRSELVRIIFDVLYLEDDAGRSQPVLKLLDTLLSELVRHAHFGEASRIFTDLEQFGDRCRSGSPLGTQVDEVVEAYSKKEKLLLLGKALKNGQSYKSEELSFFVALLQPMAVAPLTELMEDIDDGRVRRAISRGLEVLSRGHASCLSGPLSGASDMVARDIMVVLRNLGDTASIEILRSCTGHSRPGIRREAIKALQAMDSPQACFAIQSFLQDEDTEVRTAAAESLDMLHWSTDATALQEIVRQPSFHRKSFREKRALLSLLGRTGTEESLGILKGLLNRRSLFHRQQCEETRRCAELALAKAGTRCPPLSEGKRVGGGTEPDGKDLSQSGAQQDLMERNVLSDITREVESSCRS